MEHLSTHLKQVIVWGCLWIAAWSPRLASGLARLVTWLWPGFPAA